MRVRYTMKRSLNGVLGSTPCPAISGLNGYVPKNSTCFPAVFRIVDASSVTGRASRKANYVQKRLTYKRFFLMSSK